MQNCEQIVLDARIENMLSVSAFRARLGNGCPIVAWLPPDGQSVGRLRSGDIVRVRMSPYDMSKGMILEKGRDNEG